jgi:hypothetical protein
VFLEGKTELEALEAHDRGNTRILFQSSFFSSAKDSECYIAKDPKMKGMGCI